jgi:hypothetical protein
VSATDAHPTLPPLREHSPGHLTGFIQDIDSSARILSIEASRRVGSSWKAFLEAYTFMDLPEEDPSYSFRDDDFLRLKLAWYF